MYPLQEAEMYVQVQDIIKTEKRTLLIAMIFVPSANFGIDPCILRSELLIHRNKVCGAGTVP